MKQHHARIILMVFSLLLLIIFSGCGNGNTAINEGGPEKILPDGTKDEEMTDLLIEDEAVTDAYVITDEDSVFVEIEVIEDYDENEILELVLTYAEQIKNKYPNHKLSFKANQNGTLIADIEM